jgi:hypothetical protein
MGGIKVFLLFLLYDRMIRIRMSNLRLSDPDLGGQKTYYGSYGSGSGSHNTALTDSFQLFIARVPLTTNTVVQF